jgi:site-specific recombinase XerD
MLFDFYTEAEKQRKRLQITLSELFDEWQQHKSLYVTESTIKRDKTTWKSLYEGEAITKKPICTLTKADIEEWILKKVRSKEMNAHQYNNFSLVMRQMLEYAMEIEIISSNPFDQVKIPKSRILKPEVKKPSEQEVFFPDERDVLIQYAFKQYEEKRDRVQIFIPLAIAFATFLLF